MLCNKITSPKFTSEQIAECVNCIHASNKKIWCCLFGVRIRPEGEIIKPPNKIQYPSIPKMAMGFGKAAYRHIASGLKHKSKAEYERCKKICKGCDEYIEKTKVGPRCKLCGCCMDLKTSWSTGHCKMGKW